MDIDCERLAAVIRAEPLNLLNGWVLSLLAGGLICQGPCRDQVDAGRTRARASSQ